MRFPFLVVCLFFFGNFFIFCGCLNDKKTIQPRKEAVIDTSNIAVITFDKDVDWPFKHTYKPTALSVREMEQIDSLLKECAQNYNQRLAPNLKEGLSIDFSKYNYKRQYMAVLNDKGEKEVWVNSFCNTRDKQWRNEIIHVKDGGNCYFKLKINLTKHKCFEEMVNEFP